ncbi:MAG TPA: response regulator transcription factor [Candidatus Saccharimonadales bacterium]|nr:response regulator transcription factor [Candidatus Saccharimonadales bacterium]
MRILIVEDEHRIASSLKKGLESERYAVDLAYDGETGLDQAEGEDYDLLILDLMLPKLDGISICKKLRDEGNHTPILVLTARGQIENKVEGLDAGADDYLTKPFSFDELLARIRALTRRPRKSLNSVLSAGSLTLNPQNFEVKKGKTSINLTSKQFSLLEYMIRNKGKILTKEDITNHVWDYDANILPNTIEVYMRNLRQKGIKIETVRGFGYKI